MNMPRTASPAPDSTMAPSSFHSRYAPDREAFRLVESMLSGRHPSAVIILGGGLNYLSKAFKASLPGSRTVLLQPSDIFDSESVEKSDFTWSPSSSQTPDTFLGQALGDGKAAGGIVVLEWPPVMQRFAEMGAFLRRTVADYLERLSSSSATTSYWARRWLRNSLRFCMGENIHATIKPGAGPIVIACAGPGLRESLPLLGKSGTSVWALASAQEALAAFGIRPDLVLATDPGHWNSLHLRQELIQRVPFALPPSASVPAALFGGEQLLVPLDTGLAFETMAIRAAGSQPVEAATAGTAAGTAISLALRATTGSVFVAGLDLAARGLRAHANPYALDSVDLAMSTRLRPEHHLRHDLIFERYPETIGSWRVSRAFKSYSSTICASGFDAGRTYRISDSPVPTMLSRMSPERAYEICSTGLQLPSIVPQGMRGDSSDRVRAFAALLVELADRLSRRAREATESGQYFATDEATSLLALAGRNAAPLIAQAARKTIQKASVDLALAGLERGLGAFLELCNA
ncbi:MAG: DUF115 domain-containing protein [Spirochaetales bacterium]|nr:MAG: DUF115 domain-containing protein [Spirochaetales bacterium]